ncbi:MAG: radical SAM family heme chaperone HemW [Oscillospiraceae bacterium]
MSEKIGVYIHVPFCIRKCPYCDFYSLPFNDDTAAAYTAAVLRNIKAYAGKFEADTLYFGGGTPSLLGGRLVKIVSAAKEAFGLENAEITLEANPKTVDSRLLCELSEGGFNRISFGVQSLSPKELAALGRIHTADEALGQIALARRCGFENISADLMLATPYQTEKSALESVLGLSRSGVDHISAYMLKIEEGTRFYSENMQRLCPNEDETAEIYLSVCEELERLGYAQYEISNFAKPGSESKHNLKYWESGHYLGIGPSAHSYIENRRFAVKNDLKAFISSPVQEIYVTDENPGGEEEYAMLALRLAKGVKRAEFSRKFGEESYERLLANAQKLPKCYVNIGKDGFNLTKEGFLISNTLIGKIIF